MYTAKQNHSRDIVLMKHFVIFLSLCACAFGSARAASNEQQIVNQATTTLREFRAMPETGIPRSVLRNARGLAVLKVVKVGFGVSGKGGEGVVVSRTGRGWSGPSFVGIGGVGFGFQVGAQVTQFVVVLNTRAAVRAFSRDGNVTIGADVSAAAGPVGRDLQAGVLPTAAVYTYSRSKGLFAGASLEGAVIATQKEANRRYYGQPRARVRNPLRRGLPARGRESVTGRAGTLADTRRPSNFLYKTASGSPPSRGESSSLFCCHSRADRLRGERAGAGKKADGSAARTRYVAAKQRAEQEVHARAEPRR